MKEGERFLGERLTNCFCSGNIFEIFLISFENDNFSCLDEHGEIS